MKEELFNELVESVREGGAILRGEVSPSRKFKVDEERLAFFKDVIGLVRPEKMRWKAKDWNNPTEWIER